MQKVTPYLESPIKLYVHNAKEIKLLIRLRVCFSYLNPNKAGLFENSFFWGGERGST